MVRLTRNQLKKQKYQESNKKVDEKRVPVKASDVVLECDGDQVNEEISQVTNCNRDNDEKNDKDSSDDEMPESISMSKAKEIALNSLRLEHEGRVSMKAKLKRKSTTLKTDTEETSVSTQDESTLDNQGPKEDETSVNGDMENELPDDVLSAVTNYKQKLEKAIDSHRPKSNKTTRITQEVKSKRLDNLELVVLSKNTKKSSKIEESAAEFAKRFSGGKRKRINASFAISQRRKGPSLNFSHKQTISSK